MTESQAIATFCQATILEDHWKLPVSTGVGNGAKGFSRGVPQQAPQEHRGMAKGLETGRTDSVIEEMLTGELYCIFVIQWAEEKKALIVYLSGGCSRSWRRGTEKGQVQVSLGISMVISR